MRSMIFSLFMSCHPLGYSLFPSVIFTFNIPCVCVKFSKLSLLIYPRKVNSLLPILSTSDIFLLIFPKTTSLFTYSVHALVTTGCTTVIGKLFFNCTVRLLTSLTVGNDVLRMLPHQP